MLAWRHASHAGMHHLCPPGGRRLIARQADLPSVGDPGRRAVQPRAAAGRGRLVAERDLPAQAGGGWVHDCGRTGVAAWGRARSSRPGWTRFPASAAGTTVGVGRHRPSVGPSAASVAARPGDRGQRCGLVAPADRGVASSDRNRPRRVRCPLVGGLHCPGRLAGIGGWTRRPPELAARFGGRRPNPSPDRTGDAVRAGVMPGVRNCRPPWKEPRVP